MAVRTLERLADQGDPEALGRFVAERLRALRMRRPDAARDAGISESYLGHIIRGVRKRPDLVVLDNLARVLRVNEDELRYLAGYSRRDPGVSAVYPQSQDLVPRLERLARWPAAFLDRLIRVGDALFYEDEDTDRDLGGQAKAESRENTEPDEPDTGATPGR